MSELDMHRMTPAKLLLLMNKRMDRLSLEELPIAAFRCMWANANRSPGDKDKGIPPDEPKPLEAFKVFGRKKRKTLAAKDVPGGDHTKYGAQTDVGAWKSWAESKTRR